MKSNNGNFDFIAKAQLLNSANHFARSGEYRNGDYLQSHHSSAKFLILGISECIGPWANYGRQGTEQAFDAFLKFFLSMPFGENSFDIVGNIKFIGIFPENTKDASLLVEELDSFVEQILNEKIGDRQLPIIIGGGHNNALPIIRWASVNRKLQHVINIDAHMDCRIPDVRHSGNSFSHAFLQGLIQSYVVLGVDRYSLNQYLIDFVERFPITSIAFDEYMLGRSLKKDLLFFTSTSTPTGLEIDLDSMANMPSSAQSPSGFSLNQVRSAVLLMNKTNVAYLHLCEGAPTNDIEERTVGKALCYLVLDFMNVRG
jgi:formiminoglutamase